MKYLNRWLKLGRKQGLKKVVVISKDINLETLTDDDLKKLGLKRIENDA